MHLSICPKSESDCITLHCICVAVYEEKINTKELVKRLKSLDFEEIGGKKNIKY